MLLKNLSLYKIDVNAPDPRHGWTVLMYAAADGELHIVQKLLEHQGILPVGRIQ